MSYVCLETVEAKKPITDDNEDSEDDGGQIQLAKLGRIIKDKKPTKKEKSTTPSNTIKKPTTADVQRSAIEEELAVGASEEYELEQIREHAEQRLMEINTIHKEVTSILAIFTPIMINVIMKSTKYTSISLQSSAVLALCKYMCVSAGKIDVMTYH